MKILHLANFYHEKSGGIKTYLDNKRDHFVSNGFPFRLIIPGEIDSVEQSESDDVVVYRICSSPAPLNPLYRMIWDLVTVHKIAKHENPDLIEINDKYTLAAVSYFYRKIAKKKIPLVGFHHERLDENLSIYAKDMERFPFLHKLMMEIICACFDRIICASRYTAEEIEPIAPDKIKIINLGTNVELFGPKHADESLRNKLLNGADRLLLYVGRLAREKNLSLLPPMMELLEAQGINARLVVAGIGVDEHILTESGRNDIELIGFISDRNEMARLLASADALVFPTLKEPFGLVPLEALASGLPVVCSDQGGVLEYCDTEAVRSLTPKPENFAGALIDIFANPKERLQEIAVTHAANFSWHKTFEKQLTFYENLIADGVETLRLPR